MPLLTILYAGAVLVNLIVALSVAGLMAVRGVLGQPDFVATQRPVYIHLFSVGWVTQLIFGVMH